jgi:hypothetical protein
MYIEIKAEKTRPNLMGLHYRCFERGRSRFNLFRVVISPERNGKEELAPMVGSLAHIVITQTERQGNVAITIIISREGAHSQFM